MVINEVLGILFTRSSFISGCFNLEMFTFPKPHMLGQMHTSTYVSSVLIN